MIKYRYYQPQGKPQGKQTLCELHVRCDLNECHLKGETRKQKQTLCELNFRCDSSYSIAGAISRLCLFNCRVLFPSLAHKGAIHMCTIQKAINEYCLQPSDGTQENCSDCKKAIFCDIFANDTIAPAIIYRESTSVWSAHRDHRIFPKRSKHRRRINAGCAFSERALLLLSHNISLPHI